MAAATQPTYGGFVPTGDIYAFHVDEDPLKPSPTKKRKPDGMPTYNTIPSTDVTEYCCLGASYDTKYLTIDTLVARVQEEKTRRADFDAIRGGNMPFFVWDKDGTPGSMPTRLEVDIPTKGSTDDEKFKVWDKTMLERWNNAAQSAMKAPPQPYDVILRFIQPPTNLPTVNDPKIKFYFTPDEGIPIKDLKKVIDQAFEYLEIPDYSYEVLTFKAANAHPDLELISSHFFLFYHTWMTSGDFKKVLEWNQTAVLPRPFPKNDAAAQLPFDELDNKMPKVKKDTYDKAPLVTINPQKLSAASLANRKNYDDQKKVMGESATVLAKKLWLGDKGDAGGLAEWLHRSAFSFGGLDNKANVATSQTPSNLIFGTSECNTHMIRAENTIKSLFSESGDASLSGVLGTTNRRSGSINRIQMDGTRKDTPIPTWTKTKMFGWLSFCLGYEWTINSKSKLNGSFNGKCDFDPWSCYQPFRVEARLDRYILDQRFSLSKPAPVSKKVMSSKSHQVPSPSVHSFHPDSITTEAETAWRAAIHHEPVVTIAGIEIFEPKIARPPPEMPAALDFPYSTDPSFARGLISRSSTASVPLPSAESGFVLHGDIQLFGISTLIGQLEKWEGQPPDGVDTHGDPPEIERVTLKDDFHISLIIPQLQGTLFDDIIFRNVAFFHQNYAFDTTKAIGWHFNADWIIDKSCGVLYQLLHDVLGAKEPMLSIHAGLGLNQHWNSGLILHSITLEGVFPSLAYSPIEGLCLTSIGVRLLGIRELVFDPKPHSVLKFGFGIFGRLDLDVPGSIVPLILDYDITVIGEMVHISAGVEGDVWVDPLGVEDLALTNVQFASSFPLTSPWGGFVFDVSATFEYKYTRTILLGSYASGGGFTLTAELLNLDMAVINDVFEFISRDMLVMPDFDIKVESASLTISSGGGLAIILRNVEIAGYKALNAEVTVNSTGAILSGSLNDKIEFDEFELRNPFLRVAFASSGSRRRTDVMVGGVVEFKPAKLTLTIAAHLYPGKKGVEWTMLAELHAEGQTLSLSKVVPEVEGTFLDLSLRNVLFVVASKDDPFLDNTTYSGYRFKQGVQFCAMVDYIAPVDDLMREHVQGLTLGIGWSKSLGFRMDVVLPAEMSLDLGNGIRTTPIILGIKSKPVELALSAGLSIPVANSPDPLVFSLILAARLMDASATSEMRGWWRNPFGIENLSIGPVVLLSLEIIYAQFVATGTPSGFGARGGLIIGDVEAELALNISEDPRRQMLSGRVEKLNVGDIVSFASELLNAPIRDVPADFLKFEKAELYICPAGISLGSTYYPQGFSFSADMVLFGKRANISCEISTAERHISIEGGVDNFQLGPLSVQGVKGGDRAELHAIIGTTKQYLYIDGAISLFEAKVQTSIQIQLMPKPIFIFHALLQFTDLFLFQLDAELIGGIDFSSLEDADFQFDVKLHNSILEYIREQVTEQFQGAADAAAAGIDAAQEKVDEAEREWRRGIKNAQDDLERARKTWQQHNDSVRNASQPVIDGYLAEIGRLQGNIDQARKDYKNALDNARRAMEKANTDRASAMAAAQRDVRNAKSSMDRGIDNAQRALDYATRDLNSAFGNAQRAIESARREVSSLQNQINSQWRTVNDYRNAPWYEFWKKAAIAGLLVSIGALEASKAVADGVLRAAQAVLHGSAFLAKEAAVNSARLALEGARYTGYAALDSANGALYAADKTSQAAVNAAKETLKGVETGVEYGVFQGAIQALEGFKKANEAIYQAAVAAIKALLESVQYIAYQVALGALAIAEGATVVFDGAKAMLKLAKEASQAALAVLQDIINFGTRAVDIQFIHLSGTLRGILGISGSKTKPLSAAISGYFLGKAFSLKGVFNPNDPVAFITSIFDGLWKGLVANRSFASQSSELTAQARSQGIAVFGLEEIGFAQLGHISPPTSPVDDDSTPAEAAAWYDSDFPSDPHSPFRLAMSGKGSRMVFGEPMVHITSVEKALGVQDRQLAYVPRGPFSKHTIGPVKVGAWTAAKIMEELEAQDFPAKSADEGINLLRV